MPDAVVILIPVLRRPGRIAPLMAQIDEVTPSPHRVLFVASPGDTEELAALRAAKAEWITTGIDHRSGDYAKKINRGVQMSWEPLLFLGADDLCFHAGWLERARERLKPGIGVVGTNDLGNPRVLAGRHSTHSLVTRAYAERGTVDEADLLLHEGYGHNYCDTEMVQTAMRRRAFAFARDSHVEHLHPHWKKDVANDDVYRHGQSTFQRDGLLFQRRSKLWGGRR